VSGGVVVAGGKSGSGVWQRIVNQIPPCTVFVSGFLGKCAVMRRLALPLVAIGIDADQRVVDWWLERQPLENATDQTATVFSCEDVVRWLRESFRPGCFEPWGGRGGRWPRERVFVYLDPPYLAAVRRDGCRRLYRHELSDSGHRRMLEAVLALPCPVLINHPRCELYDRRLHSWRTIEYRTMGRAGLYSDCLWANYPEPCELQDYRFAGRNKRQRERIRRRCRNWLAALRRMQCHERGAVLQAIGAEFGGR
jgi:DNA adenine methylase